VKSSPSAPPAPDPSQTAAAQSQSNIATAIANAQLNRVNQQTPWGSITYTQGPAGPNGVPTWSSNIQLSPQQAALLAQQQGMSSTRNTLASQMLNSGTIRPLDLSHLHSMYDPSTRSNYAGAVNAAPPTPQAQQPGQSGQPQLSPQMLQQIVAAISSMQGSQSGQSSQQSQAQPSQQQPPTPPPQQPQPTPQSGSTTQFIRQMLTGSPTGGAANGGMPANAFGSSGIDFANALASATAGGQVDPRLSQYYSTDMQGSETPTTTFTPRDPNGPSNQGTIMMNGQPWIQLAGATDNTTLRSRDPSMFKTDPKYGLLTPAANVHSGTDAFSEIAPWLMMAPVAGAALGAAMGGAGAGVTAGGDTGAFDVGGSSGFGGSTALSSPAGTGAFDVGGSTGFGGANPIGANAAPVTDLSTTAQQPSLWQQGMTNLSQGRGLLGLRPGVSSGMSLLAQLLRQQPQSTGGSH